MSRPFNFNINAAELFTHIQSMNNDEKAAFITQFSIDLITLKGTTDYSIKVISDTAQVIEKRREAGRLGGIAKSENLAKVKQSPSKGIAKVKQSPSNKEKEKEKEIKKEYAEKVLMTEKQYSALLDKYGHIKTAQAIEKLSISKCASNKMKYDSDYHAILKWVISAVEKEYIALPSKPVYQPGTSEYKAELQKRLVL